MQLILRLPDGLRVHTLSDNGEVTFGRSQDTTFPIPDSRVSRVHTRIKLDQGAVWVEDLGSRNGTIVGGRLLRGETKRAFGGDLVRIGPLALVIAQLGEGLPSAAGDQGGIIVADPSMRHVFEVARRLAQTQTTVLILGETGSGKEVVAEQIHRWSSRSSRPFIRINCTSAPPTQIEGNGGTILLDEIGELSADMQAKLLSILENPLDVRILCATHRDLDHAVREGRFRQDLYYRINTFVLRVPPLRDRPEEILLLANHYARAFGQTLGAPEPAIDAAACAALVKHRWPGNVRELRNAMEHAMVLATDGLIRVEHLPASVVGEKVADQNDARDLEGRLADVERQSIQDALRLENGNQTKAAQRLGITRRALVYRMERLGLKRE